MVSLGSPVVAMVVTTAEWCAAAETVTTGALTHLLFLRLLLPPNEVIYIPLRADIALVTMQS